MFARSPSMPTAMAVIVVSILLLLSLSSSPWAEEGKKKWAFPAEGSVGSITSSPAIGQDGTIYVGSDDGNLYAVRPDGTQIWQFATGGKVTSSPAVQYYGNAVTLFFGATDGKIYAIHSDGTKKWEFATEGPISSSPAISHLGVIYAGSEDNKVYAVNAADGTAERDEWPFATNGEITSSPAIDSKGNVYVGSHDHKLYAIKSSGKKLWEFETGGIISASPALYESGDVNVVCVGSEDGKVYALNMADGSKKWEFDMKIPVVSSTAIDDQYVYVGANDAKLYAINLTEGTQAWVFLDADGSIRSSPLCGSDGTIYAGSDDYCLYAIKSSNGALKWRLPVGGRISSSPVMGFGGTLYVGSADGRLYAVESASPRLKNTAWPMFGHDVRHTARNRQNEGPTADAGPDQTVKSNDTVTLNGSGSSDPDYGIPLYLWSQTEGTSVTLSDATAVNPTFTAPGVDEETALTFELKVTDNAGKTDTDTITVTIQKKDEDKGCFISTARGKVFY